MPSQKRPHRSSTGSPVAEVRRLCFRTANAHFNSLTATRASLPSEVILEILKPYRNLAWSSLKSDAPYPSQTGTVSRTARDTGETAAQRAWFNRKGVDLPGEQLSFIDAEIPVCPGKDSRRRCVDLLGAYTRDLMPEMPVRKTRWVVVELKYAKTTKQRADSPAQALFEALAYAVSLYANRKDNGGHLAGHPDIGIDVTTFPDIAVVANRSYWKHWKKALGNRAKGIFELSGALQRLLATAFPDRKPRVNLYAFQDLGLSRQKGKRTTFEPKVPAGARWETLRAPSDLSGAR